MSNKEIGICFMIYGVTNFLIFAYDIENDRDFWTWLWLMSAVIGFMGCLRFFIAHDKANSK